jgi:L-alanine-DL-glutamate epimerase-like enolase superfamily enzyme
MKVTALEPYLLSAPLPQAVRTSTHTITGVNEVVVELTTDAGLVGIGEAHGAPTTSCARPRRTWSRGIAR